MIKIFRSLGTTESEKTATGMSNDKEMQKKPCNFGYYRIEKKKIITAVGTLNDYEIQKIQYC